MTLRLNECRDCGSFRFAPVNALEKPDKMYCMECMTIYNLEPARWRKTGRRFIKAERGEQ